MDDIERKIIEEIDNNKEKILNFARDIYSNAELGYKEFRTTQKVLEILEKNAEFIEKDIAITAVKAYLKEKNEEDINVALIGELDAIICPEHLYADKQTGAAHTCGHHAQLAGLVGAAIALSNEEIKKSLHGNVIFFAVPAEEYGEIEFKNSLKDKGLIKYGGGKSELIRLGEFNDIDISVVHHSKPGGNIVIAGDGTSNGFLSKLVKYKGKAAHAAGNPELGINALNAASIGLLAIAYQRETFKDEDSIRVHPILSKGGNLVNVVPEEAVVETLVRGKNIKAILDANRKIDRSFKAGALAIGAQIEITTLPGYLPVVPLDEVDFIYEIAKEVAPESDVLKISSDFHASSSTDVGDLTHIMPVLKFETCGIEGELHSKDFKVVNEEIAYIATAKIMAISAYRLLKDKAKEGKRIKNNFNATFTVDEYKEYMDKLENKFRADYRDEKNWNIY